jgi:NAD(P)-dependent dehydrogenase (short-subunit alcohol dehydrogenase family)
MREPAKRFDLSGRVALVTGGSRGLGRAIVRGLADSGATVVIASRDGAACEEYARQVAKATGVRARGLAMHVGKWDDLEPIIESILDEFGRIDVLVNNAGMSPVYPSIPEVSEVLFDKVISVNLKGPFRLSAVLGPRMVSTGGGSIINISSAGSVRPRPDIAPYAAAKAGLNAVTVALAHAFGPTVRVNAILAGTFETDVSAAWDPHLIAERTARFASKRVGTPDEIVGAVLFLASDASSYTTGSLLTIDGGQV